MSKGGVSSNPQSPDDGRRQGRGDFKRVACTMRRGVEFETVLRSGRRFASRNFVVRAHPNGGTHARLGIIAGRKVAPRSVDRNRAKRLIREMFRGALGELGAYDVTVQLRGNLRTETNARVREELAKVLQSVARLAPAQSPLVGL